MKENLQAIFHHPLAKIVTVFYALLAVWWIKIYLSGQEVGTENYMFNLSYFFFNFVGGVAGLYLAHKKWGGFGSAIGKGLSFLGLGLLAQGFGLLVWTYYNLVLMVEVPYPSLADVGYFALIPFYTFGMWYFAKATGAKSALKESHGKIKAIVIPLIILIVSYFVFWKDIGFDLNEPLRSFLDIGYPLGEAISVSLGLLTLSLSQGILGGKMKGRIIFLIFALIFQYITEFTFLYTSGAGTYYNASFVDLMYATSYFVMTLAILRFAQVDELINDS